METWQELKVTVKREGEELVSNLLIELGAQRCCDRRQHGLCGECRPFW